MRHVVKIETATEPRFQELFVAAMAFPHATAPTPAPGGASVDLPQRADAGTPTRQGGDAAAGAAEPSESVEQARRMTEQRRTRVADGRRGECDARPQ